MFACNVHVYTAASYICCVFREVGQWLLHPRQLSAVAPIHLAIFDMMYSFQVLIAFLWDHFEYAHFARPLFHVESLSTPDLTSMGYSKISHYVLKIKV